MKSSKLGQGVALGRLAKPGQEEDCNDAHCLSDSWLRETLGGEGGFTDEDALAEESEDWE